jgi:hypothetical protein
VPQTVASQARGGARGHYAVARLFTRFAVGAQQAPYKLNILAQLEPSSISPAGLPRNVRQRNVRPHNVRRRHARQPFGAPPVPLPRRPGPPPSYAPQKHAQRDAPWHQPPSGAPVLTRKPPLPKGTGVSGAAANGGAAGVTWPFRGFPRAASSWWRTGAGSRR